MIRIYNKLTDSQITHYNAVDSVVMSVSGRGVSLLLF